jgi:hypothetical protein
VLPPATNPYVTALHSNCALAHYYCTIVVLDLGAQFEDCHQSILQYFIFMLAILRMKHVQHIGLTKVLSQVGFSTAAIICTMCSMKKALDMYAWLCGQWLQKVNERGKKDQTLICAVMVLVSNE